MRDLIVTENITVDGVIEAREGWFNVSGDQRDLAEVTNRHMAAADAILVGRVTYEEFKGYWPLQTDDTTGVSAYLNRVEKYVVSATMQETDWQPTTILRGTLADEIAALKARPGTAISTTGSITLVHALIAAGLVDEYRLFVYPIILGRGRRLFAEGAIPPGLRLIGSQKFRSGVVLLTYRAAAGTP